MLGRHPSKTQRREAAKDLDRLWPGWKKFKSLRNLSEPVLLKRVRAARSSGIGLNVRTVLVNRPQELLEMRPAEGRKEAERQLDVLWPAWRKYRSFKKDVSLQRLVVRLKTLKEAGKPLTVRNALNTVSPAESKLHAMARLGGAEPSYTRHLQGVSLVGKLLRGSARLRPAHEIEVVFRHLTEGDPSDRGFYVSVMGAGMSEESMFKRPPKGLKIRNGLIHLPGGARFKPNKVTDLRYMKH